MKKEGFDKQSLIMETESKHNVFNVASGIETTIEEVALIFAKEAGIDDKSITFDGVVREGNPRNWRADISRLEAIGFNTHTQLKEGIRSYYRWARESGNE